MIKRKMTEIMPTEIIMTKKEAVELYGSLRCKIHFAKYNKFTNKDIENSLIRTLMQFYKSVETKRMGKAIVYVLGEKRDTIAMREDNRISNGAWSIPYTKNLDIIVASALESGPISETAQTLSDWSLEFGLVSRKMHKLLSAKYQKSYREKCLGVLKKRGFLSEGEERIIFDFIDEIKNINKQLAGTLERMKKAGIIDYYLVPKGFVEEGKLTIALHEETFKKIRTTERELKEYYSVNDWYLNFYYNASKSREYRKAWKEKLSQITDENGKVLGLSFWFKTYVILPTERQKKVMHYLEKYNQEVIQQFEKDTQKFLLENMKVFHEERNNRVVAEAKKRADKFLEEKTRVVELDESVVEIYGETTREEKYFHQKQQFEFDSSYYDLFFDGLYVKRIESLQNYYLS